MWATLIFCGTTALFLSMTLAALWHLRWVRRLPPLEAFITATGPTLSPSERVRCSVVIAARDEETRIEGTVRRLMAQRGVEAEFLIVDDRSTDRTGEILRRLANDNSRVKLKRPEAFPDGCGGMRLH